MRKIILASVSALALLAVAACSDSGKDNTTTQSTNPPATEQPTTPAAPEAKPPADNTMQPAPAPASPAPAN